MNFITDNLALIFSTLFGGGTLTAYIFERKKNNAVTKGVEADVSTKEIDNSTKVIELYKNSLDDLEKRYENKYVEITNFFEKRVTMLKEEIEHIEGLYARKNKLLEDEIKLKNRFITGLKKEVADLRRQLKNAENNSSK
jgi:hypothetical protein